MAADPIDLTTLAGVKERLKIATADTGHDALIQTFITAASDFVKGLSETTLADTSSITRYYNGSNSNLLDLRDRPIIAIASVHESADQDWTAPFELVEGTDFFADLELGHLYKKNFALWLRFPQAIRVIFQAGYATIPQGLDEAVKSLVVQKWRKRDSDGLQSKNLGDGSVVYFTPNDLTKDIIRQLGPYMGGGILA